MTAAIRRGYPGAMKNPIKARRRVITSLTEGWNPEAYAAARVEAGLTWDQIAERVGVTRPAARSWAADTTPRKAKLPLIAAALGVPQKRLIGRS